MRDDELRGAILQRFYDYRHRGILQLADILAAVHPAEPLLVARVSEQLAQAGLIEWKTSRSMAAVGGIGRITSVGVDVIEGHREPAIRLALHDRGVPGGASAPTPTAKGPSATKSDQVDKALAAIDMNGSPPAEKAAAKVLIRQLAADRLAWSALAVLFCSGV
jgi:hypothetical protein